MAIYVEEEEVWKCPKHPTRRRRNGICPACLRDRLVSLCPDCGKIRPCPCAAALSTASSSSSSSSGEPTFRRSRSLAIPFLRSNTVRPKTPSFLSGLMKSKTKPTKDEMIPLDDAANKIEDFARMVTRSRSVSVATAGTRRPYSAAKTKFWNFGSPLKAFKGNFNSKTPKMVVQDRSPLHRG